MSRDPRTDAYIAKAQPFARPILEHIRERVHAAAPEAEETTKWGAPAFAVLAFPFCALEALRNLAAARFLRRIYRGYPRSHRLHVLVRFLTCPFHRTVGDLPPDAELDRLIREAADLAKGAPAPRKAKHAPKPPPELHPEFAAALAKAPRARAAFDSFSPSAQRDYLEWVSEAKQDATRAKRIATAVEWLSEGKKRHWKYQNC